MTHVNAHARELLTVTRAKVYNAEDFKPGAFGLSVISGTVGKAVWAGQKYLAGDDSEFTHAWMILNDNQVIEAEPGGARIASIDEYLLGHAKIVVCDDPVQRMLASVRAKAAATGLHGELTDEHAFYGWVESSLRDDVDAIARHFERTPYGWLQYPYIGLAAHGVRSKLLRKWVGNKRVICSQLVDRIYEHVGIHLFDDGRWNGEVTPGDLWKYSQGRQ